MRSFGQWFHDQKPLETAEDASPLPDGVWQEGETYFAHCRVCDCAYELPIDPLTDGFDQNMSYCGGSPRCLP